MAKSMKIEHVLLIVAVAAVAVYFVATGGVPMQGQPGAGGVGECDSDTTPDIDINAYQVDNPATPSVETQNSYRKLGTKSWVIWTQGTAITNLEPFQTYEFVIGLNGTDGSNGATSGDAQAFGEYFRHTAKCQEMELIEKPVYPDETAGGLTATFYNVDDNAAAQAYTAGLVRTIKLRWIAGADEYFGNPRIADSGLGDNGVHRAAYPNVLLLSLNSTGWDAPQRIEIDDGTEMRRIPCPVIADTNATHIPYCYEAPIIGDSNVNFYATLDADDTNAPTLDDTAFLYAAGFFSHTDTLDLKWGVENDEATYTAGDGDADQLVLDFT